MGTGDNGAARRDAGESHRGHSGEARAVSRDRTHRRRHRGDRRSLRVRGAVPRQPADVRVGYDSLSRRRAGARNVALDRAQVAAVGEPGGDLRDVPARTAVLGLHVHDQQHAGGAAVDLTRGSGAVLRVVYARRVPQGQRPRRAVAGHRWSLGLRGADRDVQHQELQKGAHMTRASGCSALAPAQRWFSWGRLKQMIKKEAKQLVRDPKSRPIIFVSPVVQMILLGYAATTDVKDIATMVVDHDNTTESRALVDAFGATGYFIIATHSTRDADVVAALARGDVQMGLTIPPGFASDMRSGRGASVQTLFDGSDASQATVAQSYASQIAGQFGVKMVGARMGNGVELRSRAWFNPSLESKFFNVPAIMGIQILTICLILTALAVVREREIGTLDQLLVSPITSTEIMLGKTIPVLGLGLFHLLIYTGLTVFQFGVPMKGSFLALVLAALLYILAALA